MKPAARSKKSRPAGAALPAHPAALAAPTWPAMLWGVAFLVYFVAFCLGTVPVNPRGDGDMLRGEALIWAAFPDVMIEEWLGDPGEAGFTDRLPIIALVLLFLAAAASIGRAFVGLCGVAEKLSAAETLAFSTAAGLNVLSVATLALGLLGWLHNRLVFVAPLTLAASFGVVWLVGVWRKPKPAEAAINERPPLDATSRYAAVAFTVMAVVFGFFTWLSGMLPPAEFDVREYHLEAPKEFYLAKRVVFLPHNVYANMPLGSEMHALAAMVVCDDWKTGALVGKSIISCYAFVTAVALFAVASRLSNYMFGALAAALYLSTPWTYHTSTMGLIEGTFALYVLTSWYAVWLSRNAEVADSPRTSRGFLVLAGWCAGAAVACKYPALLFVVAPLFAWIAFIPKNSADGWRSRLTYVALFALFAALAGGLWLAKNAALTGNPVYPLLYSVFGGESRTLELDARWTAAHQPTNYDPFDLLRCLWDFLGGSPWQSVLLAPLAVLALFSSQRIVRPLALFLGVDLLLWWLFTHRVDRFWTPFLPAWVLLAALGAETVWIRSPAWRWAIPSATALGGAASLLLVLLVGGTYGHHHYFVQLERLWNDPHRFEPWHRMLDERTPPGETILFVGDPEPFDLQSKVLYNTVFDECLFERIAKGKTPAEVHAELQRLGVTMVYVSWYWMERYREPGNYGFSEYPQREVFYSLMNAGVFDPPLGPPAGTPRPQDEAYPVRKNFGR